MLFIISRASDRFRRNIKRYILIILELTIGLSCIACQRNAASAIEKRLIHYEKQYSTNGIAVNSMTKEYGAAEQYLSIDAADYTYFSNRYQDKAEIFYLSYGKLIYNYIEGIPIIGMSDAIFKKLFDMDMQGHIYIGSGVEELLRVGK